MDSNDFLSGRVTTKGQVTIPIEIRRALNIEEGDRLEFLPDIENKAVVKVIKKRSLHSVFGKLPIPKAISFEEERKQAHIMNGKANLTKDMQEGDLD